MISTTIFRSDRGRRDRRPGVNRAVLTLLVALGVMACSESDVPGPGQERIPPGEAAAIARVIAGFEAAIAHRDGDGLARRGAHPKHHGCVQARFTVSGELPEAWQVGLLRPGASYPAVVRFSNNADPQPDFEPDVRGMAIKLFEVGGARLFQPDTAAGTHDLLLVSHPVFLFPDVATYAKGFEAIGSGRALSFFFNPFDAHVRAFLIVRDMLARHADLLDIRWFSMVPYRFGEGRAVKYGARPCATAAAALPADPGEDFLGERLADRLRERDACFEFGVQVQVDPARMPIEDPSVEWNESVSPFETVARLEIPAQTFGSPAQMAYCENLSFNPWRALPDHRPLGGINRARRVIYESISNFRRTRNATSQAEPRQTGPDVGSGTRGDG